MSKTNALLEAVELIAQADRSSLEDLFSEDEGFVFMPPAAMQLMSVIHRVNYVVNVELTEDGEFVKGFSVITEDEANAKFGPFVIEGDEDEADADKLLASADSLPC